MTYNVIFSNALKDPKPKPPLSKQEIGFQIGLHFGFLLSLDLECTLRIILQMSRKILRIMHVL